MSTKNHDVKVWMYDSDWTADDASSAADAGYIFDVVEPITVVEVGALVTTVMDGAATVNFDRRVLTASDTGRLDGIDDSDTATIVVPTATAVGKYVFTQLSGEGFDCDIGDQIVPVISSAATSGGLKYVVKYVSRDETIDNQDDAVESA